jgi:hypothetical protein
MLKTLVDSRVDWEVKFLKKLYWFWRLLFSKGYSKFVPSLQILWLAQLIIRVVNYYE